MVGLFFTVISMINTFNAIGEQAATGKAKEIGGHASKIGLALFATAIGLFTAIPLVFSHVLFKEWIARVRDQDEGRVAEAHHAGDQLQEGPEAARQDPSISTRTRRNAQVEGGGEGGSPWLSRPKAFDVWFVAANTVYKGVPYNVVADWTQQGRLAATDMVRPAGTNMAWATVAEHEFLSDYLPRAARRRPCRRSPRPRRSGGPPPPVADRPRPSCREPEELDRIAGQPRRGGRRGGHDPADRHQHGAARLLHHDPGGGRAAAGRRAGDEVRGPTHRRPDAITITIEKLNEEEVYYSVRVGPARRRSRSTTSSTPRKAIEALNELLASVQRPPEVRIACRKDLPRERVYRDPGRELEPLQKKGYINNFVATVVEAPRSSTDRGSHVRVARPTGRLPRRGQRAVRGGGARRACATATGCRPTR